LSGGRHRRLSLSLRHCGLRAALSRSDRPIHRPSLAMMDIKGTPAAVIGDVEAPDADSAIKEAIRQFNTPIPNSRGGLPHEGYDDWRLDVVRLQGPRSWPARA